MGVLSGLLKNLAPEEYKTANKIIEMCKKYNMPEPKLSETYIAALEKVLDCMKNMDEKIESLEKTIDVLQFEHDDHK